jgi:OOP family OmpA-OmpF porin
MKFLLSLFMLLGMQVISSHIDAQGILGKIKDKVKSKAEKTTEKKEETKKEDAPKEESSPGADSQPASSGSTASSTETTSIAAAPVPLKVYQNYDFVPGEKIIFEDNFVDDQDGEFPAHWKLAAGQAVINNVDGKPAFLLTEGNYARVTPRIKTEKYISGDFTLEFDFRFMTDHISYPIGVELYYGDDKDMRVAFGDANVTIGDFQKAFPEDLKKDFLDHWHHAALILKSGQMKGYVDQYRVCVNPNIDFVPYKIAFSGIGSENEPIVFSNVKLAEGGGMNVIGQKFTEGKIVTHGITFDVNKSVIKPQSMGTLNGIAKLLKDNAAVKFEIGGYTDGDGDDAANKVLSQERANAVLKQLVSMGIDEGRLTAKGYGETKPIGDNGTPEGKAANRRVEFVKK